MARVMCSVDCTLFIRNFSAFAEVPIRSSLSALIYTFTFYIPYSASCNSQFCTLRFSHFASSTAIASYGFPEPISRETPRLQTRKQQLWPIPRLSVCLQATALQGYSAPTWLPGYLATWLPGYLVTGLQRIPPRNSSKFGAFPRFFYHPASQYPGSLQGVPRLLRPNTHTVPVHNAAHPPRRFRQDTR